MKAPLFCLLLFAGANAMAANPAKHPADHPPMQHVMVHAATTAWGPAPAFLPPGAQAAVLVGDPGKPGVFTLRLKFPPGYRIPRHWHPTNEAVTVIEGEVSLSMGTAADAHVETFAPGDFINLPAHMQHEASAKGGAVVQVQSTGPSEIHYIDPKDDPRKPAGHKPSK